MLHIYCFVDTVNKGLDVANKGVDLMKKIGAAVEGAFNAPFDAVARRPESLINPGMCIFMCIFIKLSLFI